MNVLATTYGLRLSIKLAQIDKNHLGIVKRIKSRIIQKDAMKIVEVAQIIRKKDSKLKVSLICNNNICSKSVVLLCENGIEVIH